MSGSKPIHGHTSNGKESRTYRTWTHMKNRCLSSTYHHFQDYGGRGIGICQRWVDSFEDFLADMGERPTGTSIERIDNDGNYEPGNCRWATRLEQSNNSRHVKKITKDGYTLSQKQWSLRLFGKKHTIAQRINRGWSLEEAMAVPLLPVGYTVRHLGRAS